MPDTADDGGWFNPGKWFGGGEPAAAPAATTAVDVSDAAKAEPTSSATASSAAVAEPGNAMLKLTPEQIEAYEPAEVIEVLRAAVTTTPDIDPMFVELCCKRLRVLCREPENCKRCDEVGTAAAVVGAMGSLPKLPRVQLQALAALVNLCSGEANEHRKNAVEAKAMTAIVQAMATLDDNAEVQEMACIALQNCCYGEDTHALVRRKEAADQGAITQVVKAMGKWEDNAPMQEVGAATLRLIVHKLPELREKALAEGAKEEWVKPIMQSSGGFLSFRKGFGFGTSRRKTPKSPGNP